MKFCVVFATVVAVSFGAAVPDTSLEKDLKELAAMVPQQEIIDLVQYYGENDAEFRNVATSKDYLKLAALVLEQPEFKEFGEWVAKHFSPFINTIQKMSLMLNEHHKPGWKGFMEEYIALIPTEKIQSFIQEKVAEGGVFAEFWSRLQALRPAYESFIRSPEVVETVQRLEALGFDGAQYDSLVRDQLGWH